MYKHLFGPVPSRRLGMSLGIDLVPKKVCSLNCIYCEVGKTTKLTTARLEYVKYDKVIAELVKFMGNNPKVDYMTFSGSGEPTLNINIGHVLSFIKKEYPKVKTALLTNGTLLHDPKIRKEISSFDVILPSLDAGSKMIFEKINRPHSSLSLEVYVQGLIDLRNEFQNEIWLEVLFLKGINDTPEELSLLKEALLKIKPDRIQLNTLDRPGTEGGLIPLSKEELQEISVFWNLPDTEIIASPPERAQIESYRYDIEKAILETISRRPCTLEDLHQQLGIHVNEINKYLGKLDAEDRIETTQLERGTFYRAPKS